MPFEQDTAFADAVGGFFGTYHSTFRSQGGQVTAHLFEQGDLLVAYVSFAPGLHGWEVTDPYVGELTRYAEGHGFAGRLKTVYS